MHPSMLVADAMASDTSLQKQLSAHKVDSSSESASSDSSKRASEQASKQASSVNKAKRDRSQGRREGLLGLGSHTEPSSSLVTCKTKSLVCLISFTRIKLNSSLILRYPYTPWYRNTEILKYHHPSAEGQGGGEHGKGLCEYH
jgi:hypothetical protein